MSAELIAIISVCFILASVYGTFLLVFGRHTGPVYNPPSS